MGRSSIIAVVLLTVTAHFVRGQSPPMVEQYLISGKLAARDDLVFTKRHLSSTGAATSPPSNNPDCS